MKEDRGFEAMGVIITDNEVPVSFCPTCGLKLDRAASLEGKNPEPGDISICIKCENIMVFDEMLKLRVPMSDEIKEIKEALDQFRKEI